MSSETKLEIFADYHQFYLSDEGATLRTENLWTDPQSNLDMIDVGPGEVAVGTVRNFTVPVIVRILDSGPEYNPDRCDHVTEASLKITSGRLVVMGCTDHEPDAKRIPVEPGHYRVRFTTRTWIAWLRMGWMAMTISKRPSGRTNLSNPG